MSICNLDHFVEAYWRERRFVLVSGCFDPLHEGHLRFFEEARRFGPVVVALAPDAEIAEKRTPCLPAMTRLKVLNACRDVEHVHLTVPHGVAAVVRALRPVRYVVGEEYRDRLPGETVAACAAVGAPIEFLDCREQSSTALLGDYDRRRNAEKLTAFEMWMQRQSPVTPWEPVTDYSREARRVIEAPHADRVAEVFQGYSVLDYGCGFGYLVELLRERGMTATGWDPQFSHPYAFISKQDLVICREVLEHVPIGHLHKLILELVGCATKYIYITTRFTAKSHLLDFDAADDLDPTHRTLLNQDFLRLLFVLEGCHRRADLETQLDWQHKGRVLVYEVPHD